MRRRKSPALLPLWLVVVAAALLAAIAVIGAISSLSHPWSSAEGHRWTVQELAEHLNRRGFRCELHNLPAGQLLVEPGTDVRMVNALWKQGIRPEGVVGVERLASAEVARQTAGGARGAFAWGVFVLSAEPKTLERVESILR